MSLFLDEKFAVKLARLIELEQKEKELEKAKRLIKLLRAEKAMAAEQKKEDVQIARKTIEQLENNYFKKYGAFLLAKRLGLW
jgi:DNA-binding XRE family transcriptional regulator